MNGAEDGGFETRKGEVKILDSRVGEFVFIGVSLFGCFSNRWTTRIWETEDFGDFVEAFADGVWPPEITKASIGNPIKSSRGTPSSQLA